MTNRKSEERVLTMHSRRWKFDCRAMGSDYWQFILHLRFRVHKQVRTSSPGSDSSPDSLLMSDTKTDSEGDELSDRI